MHAQPRSDLPLVSPDWLQERLQDPRVRVLDCRFYFDDVARGRQEYLNAHIPGAQYLDWSQDLSEPRGDLKYMAPSATHLKVAMERLGISDDTIVVGYDDEGGHYVSRLWSILRRYGHEGVRILNGGWTRWMAEGRPVHGREETSPSPGTFTPRDAHPEFFVDAGEVLRRRQDPDTVLLDVRRWSEFTGEEVRSKHGGRIPGATWALWQDNLNWDGDRSFRDLEAVRQRYEDLGVTPEKKVIAYCHGGVRASHTAMTLGMLGYPNVQVYDGSWEEWGSRDDLPIAEGEPQESPKL